MKISKMLPSVLASCLLLLGASSFAGADSTTSFAVNARMVVSTVAASPTLISAADRRVKRTTLINPTTYYCLFGDSSTSFNTNEATGTARVINASFSPDGIGAPYQGAIYAVCQSSPIYVDCIRVK